jgi:hypothetical protein
MAGISRRLVLLLAVVAVVGCGISPQPTPPAAQPEIHAALLTMETAQTGSVEIAGEAGAVGPGAGVIRVANLDDASADAEAPVATDGSFTVVLTGDLAQAYRLQAIDEARSRPLDITGTTEGAPVATIPVPFGACLASTPEAEVDFGPVGLGSALVRNDITFDNGCGQTITLVGSSLRKGGVGAFVLLQPGQLPLALDATESGAVAVGFKAPLAGEYEDILFVTLETATGPRRIVTVHGQIVP